ncbi:hypothetical protein C162_14835 [Paenibacillus sp. FSL R7-269]|uniref:hypothetical protein n=1 Tax=Paenibacillus sp. FSL R7-269 TaxID=1226755 RepID=UPI0003E2699E|nr:hypothetical protein [Paenibacillus sp. FSL R7-269]ETT48424.1 hypothetical protein C162_14835 [Paenibacillus sp. FSL R7-269]
MNELLELRLEVLPGVIKATGSVGPVAEGTDRRSGKARAGIEKQGVRAEKERRAEQGQGKQAETVRQGERASQGERAEQGQRGERAEQVKQGQRVQQGQQVEPVPQVQREAVTLRIPQWTPARKNEALHQLSAHPGELYDLLQGSLNGGLAALELLPADDELRLAADEQGTGLLPAEELVGQVQQQLTQEPLLAFALRGLSKEELLSGVFALWAEQENERSAEEDAPASVSLASELARLERKGPAVSSGEWLAEAAAEGSLHQPGPLFHEISSRPFPAMPEVMEPEEDWSALLPQTPKAREGLALLMRRVSEAAAKRAAGLNKL